MKFLIKTGRCFFALALIVYGLQQFYFGTFRDVFFSPYQSHLPFLRGWAYLFGAFLAGGGVLLILGIKGRAVALSVGLAFLILFLFTHLPYEFISEPNRLYHQGLWVNQLKELGLAGGAFVVAGSFPNSHNQSRWMTALGHLIPYGNLFFLFMLFMFGTGHLVYIEYMQLPDWVHDKTYWIYFSGIALFGSAIVIGLGIRIRAVALLLAAMIFCWVWLMHFPWASQEPLKDRGNLVASMFDALAFSGTALLIAFTMKEQKWIRDLENVK